MSVMTGHGARKAAIVLVRLGKERAAQVLAHMSEEEVEAVSAEIAQLAAVEPSETQSVMGEFSDLLAARQHMLQGGMDLARDLLQRSLGDDRAEEAVQRLNARAVQLPFQFLGRADPTQLRSFIREEHPQVIALVLAHMTAEKASLVLSGLVLGPAGRGRAPHRRDGPGQPRRRAGRGVGAGASALLGAAAQHTSRVGGLGPLVNIINRADRSTERQIVEGLESLDAVLAEEVAAGCSSSRTSSGCRTGTCSRCCARSTPAASRSRSRASRRRCATRSPATSPSERRRTCWRRSSCSDRCGCAQVEEAQQAIIRTIRSLEEQRRGRRAAGRRR